MQFNFDLWLVLISLLWDRNCQHVGMLLIDTSLAGQLFHVF